MQLRRSREKARDFSTLTFELCNFSPPCRSECRSGPSLSVSVDRVLRTELSRRVISAYNQRYDSNDESFLTVYLIR